MPKYRIEKHPILSVPECEKIAIFLAGPGADGKRW